MNLIFEEGAKDRIAELAFQKGLGARGLRSIVEYILNDALYKASEQAPKTVIVYKDLSVDFVSPEFLEKRKKKSLAIKDSHVTFTLKGSGFDFDDEMTAETTAGLLGKTEQVTTMIVPLQNESEFHSDAFEKQNPRDN